MIEFENVDEQKKDADKGRKRVEECIFSHILYFPIFVVGVCGLWDIECIFTILATPVLDLHLAAHCLCVDILV